MTEHQRKKSHNFFPKMFKAFTLYFVITLCVFFGYIQLFGNVGPNIIQLPTGNTDAEDSTLFGQFIENFSSFDNIDADFSLSIDNSQFSLSAQGNVVFDLQTGNLSVDLDLNYDNKIFAVEVDYKDPYVYLSIDGKTYKIDVSNGIDIGAIVQILGQYIELDVDSLLDDLSKFLGVDLKNFDPNDLLSQLKISEKKDSSTGDVSFVIELGTSLSAQMICDENFNIKTIHLRDVIVAGNTIKFNANVNGMNLDDILAGYVENGNEIDLSGLTQYVNYAKNLFNNQIVGVDVKLNINDQIYAGQILFDKTNDNAISLTTNYEGMNIKLVYVGEMIYLNAGGLKVSFKVKDFNLWKSKIDQILQAYTSKSLTDFVEELMSKYLPVNDENNEDILSQILNLVFENVDGVSKYLPSSTTNDENSFVLLWENGTKLQLDNNNAELSQILLESSKFNFLASFFVSNEGIDLNEEYYDLSNLLPLTDKVTEILKAKQFAGDLTVDIKDFVINGNYVFDFSNKIMAKINFTIFDEDVAIYLNDRQILVEVGNLVVEGNLDNLPDYLAKIDKTFGTSLSSQISADITLTVEQIIEKLNVIFADLKLDKYEDTIALIQYLSNQFSIKMNDNAVIVNFNNKDVNVDMTMQASSQTIKIPTANCDINDIENLVDSFKIKENIYAVGSEIAIRYSNNQFYGNLVALLIRDERATEFGGIIPAVSIQTTSLGLSSYVYLIGNDVYIDINGLLLTANLSENTISEVLSFIENDLGISFAEAQTLEATKEAFSVILPAIENIHASWISGDLLTGLQINVDDDLWYQENARFYDIVLQIVGAKSEGKISPSSIVLGANIDDKNTTVYDDYSQYWLKDGDVVIENQATKGLNFAVYLQNVTAGQNIVGLSNIFIGENDSYNNIIAVKSNYGQTELKDFNSYKTLLKFVKAIYGYGLSQQYQFDFSATISGQNLPTVLNGNAIIEVGNLQENEINTSGFELFDGKWLKVQGDLDITTDGVRHLLSLFYESNNSSALYASYSHGEYINSNDVFRAKISNKNLSQIISMALAFGNVDLGETLTKALSLGTCTTDFRYLQSLLNIGNDSEDDFSQVDKTLSSIENVLKIINNITLSTVDYGNGMTGINLSLDIDWEGKSAEILIETTEELKADGTTESKLKTISISNFCFGESRLDLDISFTTFDKNNFDYDTTVEHIDFSEISSFVDVAVNTINTKSFSFKGKADIFIDLSGSGVDNSEDALLTVNYDLLISLDKNGKFYFYLELDVPSFIDVTYDAGGFGSDYTYYSALAGFDNRISQVEYLNGVLNITQTTYGFRESLFHSKETKVKTWTHSKEQIGENIMLIMAQALGLTNTVYDQIKGLIASMNPNPSLEKTILGFSKVAGGYMLSLDGETLIGSSDFGDLNILLGVSKVYTNIDGKEYQFIDHVETTLNIADIVIIPVNLESDSSGTSYTTGAGKEIYTNDYYRKTYIDNARYRKVSFKTYTADAPFDSLLLAPGEEIIFPILTTKQTTIDGITTYYDFDGWYMDSIFKTPANVSIMPDSDITFYAKWKVNHIAETKGINVYDNGELLYTLRVQEGETIDFSNLKNINENTKFYCDADYKTEFTDYVMPSHDIDVYIRNLYTITLTSAYGTAGTFTYQFYQGETIELPVQNSYVVDDGNVRTTYTFTGYSRNDEIMPNQNIEIVANWEVETKHYYTITFDLRWYYVLGCTAGSEMSQKPAPIAPLRVLEGTVLDLTQYQPTCKAYTTAIHVSPKNYKATSWGTSPWENYTQGGSGFTTFTVVGDQTLYACWERY